jgi:hypothetical protein
VHNNHLLRSNNAHVLELFRLGGIYTWVALAQQPDVNREFETVTNVLQGEIAELRKELHARIDSVNQTLVGLATNAAGTASDPGFSCLTLYKSGGHPTGKYYINSDPSRTSTSTQEVWCDMDLKIEGCVPHICMHEANFAFDFGQGNVNYSTVFSVSTLL